jgi:hypothetical protein
MQTAFAGLVAASLKTEYFTIVDVGCSGGIDPVWRLFADRLRAVGFDASVDECRRLAAEETHAGIKYVAGFTDIAPDHPFAVRSAGKPPLSRNPWRRLSADRAAERRAERLKDAPLGVKLENNAWSMTELADPSQPVVVPDMLRSLGIGDVDFLKIDIDGNDFRVLNSFDGELEALGMLAVRLEVNLYGDGGDTSHTFHNTDRFMRDRGFDLVAIDSRSYSMHALPARFAITVPGQTETGRVYQADAYYVRDLATPELAGVALTRSSEKILKLAAMFSLWKQPDSAAELLLAFRGALASLLDVDAALDLLAAQAQPGVAQPLSHGEYMASFDADQARFYPRPWSPPPPATLARRLAAAWAAFNAPNKLRRD